MYRFLFALLVALLPAASVLAQDAKARLEKSPRHGEWVNVKQGGREVESFLVFPEAKEKTTAIVVIHEIFGLTDWVRLLADELAEAGYIAIAPNLVPGLKEGESFDNLRKELSKVPQAQITADLDAVAKHVSKLPSCNGKVVVCGFCWGGGQAFNYATHNKDIKAAFVFYGSPPAEEKAIERIACPVYGFYGENDNRINATIPKTKDMMKQAGKKYDPVIYKGAGHGFMRMGDYPNGNEPNHAANVEGRQEAWKRWKELLKPI